MTKLFLKISGVCAACWMLAGSAWAQADSQSQNQPSSDSSANRSWSTKHLSATGRENPQSVRASKLDGAQVNDSSGQRIATLQDVIINPSSGRVDFALLSLNANGTTESSSAKLVPVPWSLLKTASSSSQYSSSSEQPTFTFSGDKNKLSSAPALAPSDLSQSEWQQRVYSYYGVTPNSPSSMGGSESPNGEMKGEGARHMENSTPDRQQPTTP